MIKCLQSSVIRKIDKKYFSSLADKQAYLKSWLGSDVNTNVDHLRPRTTENHQTKVPHNINSPADDRKNEPSAMLSSVISLTIDWSVPPEEILRSIKSSNDQITCLMPLDKFPQNMSAEIIAFLSRELKTKGYKVIASNVPTHLFGKLSDHGVVCVHDPLVTNKDASSISSTPDSAATTSAVSDETDFSSQVYVGTVRSGQQMYAQGKSLVVIGNVNSGAEVMADGDIFVFGRLMGRAIAGIGDGRHFPSRCSIYSTNFMASLVGIQSVFLVPDEHNSSSSMIGKSVRISLQDSSSASKNGVSKTTSKVVDIGTKDGITMVLDEL